MAYNTQYGNQYADRIYAEHPIAMWPLDEDIYYLSLINNNHRLFSNWTLTNCTATDSAYPVTPDIPSPFDSDIFSSLTADTTNAVTITAVSDDTFNPAATSAEINTFCVNFWLWQKPTFVNWIKVGYEYTHTTLGLQTVLSDEISPDASASWMNFNNVYEIPADWTGYVKLVIQVDFADTTSESDDARSVIMTGLSVGQNSQTTCFTSLGSEANFIPSEIGFASTYGIPADQYGIQSGVGYYIVRNNRLLAYNDGFPIIYGTNHSTKIYPSGSTMPSFVFPGKGMLHESGRNKQYTLEMWMKLDPSTTIPLRIVGPVSSNDGLWVKEGFLTLAIGDQIGSHCVGEWYRPMLVHIILKENNAVVLLNGEQVINIQLDRPSLDLPSTRDWWGVYSYQSMAMFSIDSISIYPYVISELVAKRRFVYGQGTPSIQSINDSFSGTPVTVDFSTAEYSNNIIYPDIERWDAGYFNNLNATKNYISVPNYELPVINIDGRDVGEWYENNYIVNTLEYPDGNHPKFVTFRPNITYDINGDPQAWDYTGVNYTGASYFNFPTLSVLNETVAAVYGIFEVEENLPETRTLISFSNVTNGSTFDIIVQGDQVKYLINGVELLGSAQTITLGIECLVGLNFESAGLYFGYEVSQFFSSPSSIQMYVGGNGTNTFEGKIYLIGFCNQSNYDDIHDLYPNNEVFLANGLTNAPNYELMIDHIASYTLIPEYAYGRFYLDISVSSEWEEYFPLTRLASYVKDSNGDPYYDLDMIQLNLGYASVSSTSVWQYSELKQEFVGDTYADLEASVSVYDTYFWLKKRNVEGTTISVANSSMQAYLTFQSIADGANTPLSSFVYTKSLGEDMVIDPDLENTLVDPERAYQTKFLFQDNTILYPPKSKNFEDYAMVVHFVINQRSILKNPLKIKSFEIASKNLNYEAADDSQRNYIGTKFGTKAYPEVDLLGFIDYKEKNPFTIYKTNTPYLYTTKKSGLKVGNQTSIISPPTVKQYKVAVPVNPNGSYNFNMGAMSFFMLGDLPDTTDEIPFMEIEHKNGTITFILQNGPTGTSIKAYDKSVLVFLDGGAAETTLFSDDFDGGLSTGNVSMTINVTVASVPNSPAENGYTIIFLQNGVSVDIVNDTITFATPHGYLTGTRVMYTSSNPITGLTHENDYYVRAISALTIALYNTEADAIADTNRVDLLGSPSGSGAFTEYPYVEITGYEFYQNGRFVKSPSINDNEWNYIGITFPSGLDFSEFYDGEIRLFGGFTFNNLSYYLSEGLGIKTDVTVRVWSEVLNESDISNATGDGTFVTYTTQSAHGLLEGQHITISDISPPSLNVNSGTVNSVVDEFNFTVSNSSTDMFDSEVSITSVSVSPSGDEWEITYTANNSYYAGQTIRVFGLSPSTYNVSNATISSSTATEFSIIVPSDPGTATVTTGTASSGSARYVWQEWADVPWSTAYVLGQTTSYITTPADIYASYTGTNRDVIDDDSGISLAQVEAVAITDAAWSLYSGKPA